MHPDGFSCSSLGALYLSIPHHHHHTANSSCTSCDAANETGHGTSGDVNDAGYVDVAKAGRQSHVDFKSYIARTASAVLGLEISSKMMHNQQSVTCPFKNFQ